MIPEPFFFFFIFYFFIFSINLSKCFRVATNKFEYCFGVKILLHQKTSSKGAAAMLLHQVYVLTYITAGSIRKMTWFKWTIYCCYHYYQYCFFFFINAYFIISITILLVLFHWQFIIYCPADYFYHYHHHYYYYYVLRKLMGKP